MATAIEARRQLSKDLGDFFFSTTTGIASAADNLVDALLIDKGGNNQDAFLTDLTTIWVEGGQVGGPSSDEERRVDRDTSVLSTGTLDTFRDFGATIQDSVEYELHRLFNAAEKDEAVTQALTLVVPLVWAHKTADITMVADQYDYNITANNFYRNIPHQIEKVSPSDTEITKPVHAWKPINGTSIHLMFTPTAGEDLRLVGITEPTLAGLDTGELLIVSARAGIYLMETALNGTRVDQFQLFTTLLSNLQRMYTERLRLYVKPAPHKQLLTEAFDRMSFDRNFGIP